MLPLPPSPSSWAPPRALCQVWWGGRAGFSSMLVHGWLMLCLGCNGRVFVSL